VPNDDYYYYYYDDDDDDISFASNIVPSSKNGVTDQFLKVFSKKHRVMEFHKIKNIFGTSVLDIRQDSSGDAL
jgi:hypothetical protein